MKVQTMFFSSSGQPAIKRNKPNANPMQVHRLRSQPGVTALLLHMYFRSTLAVLRMTMLTTE